MPTARRLGVLAGGGRAWASALGAGAGVGGEGVAGGGGPQVVVVGEALVGPAAVGLDPVVGAAQGREVGQPGLARWSAVLDRAVGVDVVQVAAAGVAAAAGEHAGGVDLDGGLPHPGRWVVPVHGVGGVQVRTGWTVIAARSGRPSQAASRSRVAAPSRSTTPPPRVGSARWVNSRCTNSSTRRAPVVGSPRTPVRTPRPAGCPRPPT